MKITDKKIDNSNIILEIKIKESDYIDTVNSQLSDYQKKMTLPGFRVGKVPMGLVKKKYELSIKVEEINKLISHGIQKYITEKKISILGGPIPVDKAIDFKKDVDYIFEYELGLQPVLDLSLAEKSKLDYWLISPASKEVKDHITNITKRYGQVIHPEKIDSEDMLNVSFQELDNNNPKKDGVSNTSSLLVDKISDTSIRKKFMKLKKSDSIIIPIHKAFSNKTDLASMLNISKESAESLNTDFSCTINNINRLVPAEINNDLFKKVYPEKTIKNKKDFEKYIKEELSQRYVKESDRKLFNDGSLLFMKKTKIELPHEFLKKWLKMNAKKEFQASEFEKEYKNYVKYLSWQLIENKICEENNIKITNEALHAFTKQHVLEQMKSYGNVQMDDKEIEGIVGNVLKNKQEAEKMTNELVLMELVKYFKNTMKIKTSTITLDEFIKLANNQK
tara:strand:- start:84 stop:1430 length:1347 start_codon:yes stop_codon:yes gene_type:complete